MILQGRRISARQIELDSPLPDGVERVEVLVREPVGLSILSSLLGWIESLPPGTRSKEQIDEQVREERVSWGE